MLGRLEKVELRDVWKHEALDFTNWLAKEENIELLSESIGIDIEVLETEASVGSFNVDILARDNGNDSKIIIENQLERTDHDHLGKIITYASGYDAETIIWIVKDVREEHKKAIEWLNNHLDDRINIFLIKIEVWRIGDSTPAPKFNIIESPNNWAKTVKTASNSNRNVITDTKNLQLEFWTKLKEYGEDNYPHLSYRAPRPQHWYEFSVGSSEFKVSITVNTKENKVGAEIYINDSKELFFKFYGKREDIEDKLGYSLEWMELPNKKGSRAIVNDSLVLNDRNSWKRTQEWILVKVEELKNTFNKYK